MNEFKYFSDFYNSMKVPISDGHAHVSPKGLGIRTVAKKFKEVHGWFIALVSLPPYHYDLTLSYNDLIKSFNLHIEQCKIAKSEGLRVACILGLHPALIDRLVRYYQGRRRDLLLYIDKALDYIERKVKEDVIDGIGEFGRPHYKVLPEVFALNEYVLIKALNIVHDYSVPIHLHLEDSGLITVESINSLINLFNRNLGRKYIIFHHASRNICMNASQRGFSSTITGRKELLEDIISNLSKNSLRLVSVESDYIDDLKRPGVVMYPWEIANEVSKILKDKPYLEDELHEVLIESIINIYGVNPP
ncbi:MAG: hypothetical protein B6U85_08330 [Desulfurococcales archaeon ex4484_42]|nr:MAG: hypothetical protein B6U85_08330 [Desulfurococcales archaeon ex4484_42]